MIEDISQVKESDDLDKEYPDDGTTFWVRDSISRAIWYSNKDVREAIRVIREKMPIVKAQLEKHKLDLAKATEAVNESDETNPFHSILVYTVRCLNAKVLGYEYDIRTVENAITKRLVEVIVHNSGRFKRVHDDSEFIYTDIGRVVGTPGIRGFYSIPLTIDSV